MKNEKGHIRILTTLSLAASEARVDTLTSIILNTLYEKGPLKLDDVSVEVEKIYNFSPYRDEINTLINKLVDNKSVENNDAKYQLAQCELERLNTLDQKIKDKEKERFQNFKNFLSDEIKDELSSEQSGLLWKVFIEFLYSNFYEYGTEALYRFHPYLEGDNSSDKDEDFFHNAYIRLQSSELSSIFRIIVEKFPDYATQKDLDFLNDLAQKTLSFASLGVDPKIAESTLDRSLINWVLYLDTNVLYSILELHSNPENESSQALIQLINSNAQHINITLRYSELTKKELSAKRNDFELLDNQLTNSAIKAILRTEGLDDFSKQFYEHLLIDRDSTVHPSQIIDLSTTLLKDRKIDISRNQKRLEQLGEGYLDSKIQDYRRFISRKNEIKMEFCALKRIPFREIYRSDKQIKHDIILREIIMHQRASFLRKNNEVASMNSIKYYAVTLDYLLLEFDKIQTKENHNEQSFPVFFKPSYLLNKLIKILPIKTDDYKKAFLKAVSSRGFNKDIGKSRDILRIVNYLKKRGIDSESVIYNLLSEDLFLERFKQESTKSNFDQGEFIDSEINRELKERETALKTLEENLSKQTQEAKLKEGENNDLKLEISNLRSDMKVYKSAVKKLSHNVKKIQEGPTQNVSQKVINFEAEEERKQKDKFKKELTKQINRDIRLAKSKEFKKWQRKALWNLMWVIPITIGSLYVIIYPDVIPLSTLDPLAIRMILGVLLLLLDGIFLYLIKMRFWDEGNKDRKMTKIPIPDELQTRLDQLEK